MRRAARAALLAAAAAGCASPRAVPPSFSGPVVLARADGAAARPAWLDERRPFTISGGVVSSVGEASIAPDDRLDAGTRIAQTRAEAAVAAAVSSRLTAVLRLHEDSNADSPQVEQEVVSASRMASSAFRPAGRYWEKISIMGDVGRPVVRVRVFARVTMPEAEFRKAVLDSLSADESRRVGERWESFAGER